MNAEDKRYFLGMKIARFFKTKPTDMKHFFLFLTFSFISTSILFAQGDNGVPEVKYNQWEVGMDVVWLLKKEYSPTVFLRKNTLRPKKNEFGVRKNAYRLSFYMGLEKEIDYKLDTFNFQSNNIYAFHKHTENSFGLRLGYEWNKKIESVVVYYGGDIGSTYKKNTYGYLDYTYHSYDMQSIFYTIDLIPFAGIKYNITKNILASIESNLILSYRLLKDQRDLSLDSKHEAKKQSVILNYMPVRMIAISYLF